MDTENQAGDAASTPLYRKACDVFIVKGIAPCAQGSWVRG
jgi:hypothetical protein